MLKFLLDANLSFETRDYLNSLGYKTFAAAQFNLSDAEDSKIIEFAKRENLMLITLDLDFGQIYYFSAPIPSGMIILKLNIQTVESVNKHLARLIESRILQNKKYHKSLIIVDEKKIRIKTRI